MDFTEVSLTDPFMAMFIAAQKQSCAKWTNRVVNLSKDIRYLWARAELLSKSFFGDKTVAAWGFGMNS